MFAKLAAPLVPTSVPVSASTSVSAVLPATVPSVAQAVPATTHAVLLAKLEEVTQPNTPQSTATPADSPPPTETFGVNDAANMFSDDFLIAEPSVALVTRGDDGIGEAPRAVPEQDHLTGNFDDEEGYYSMYL